MYGVTGLKHIRTNGIKVKSFKIKNWRHPFIYKYMKKAVIEKCRVKIGCIAR